MNQNDCEALLIEKSRDQETIVSRCMRRNSNLHDKDSVCPNCPNYKDSSLSFLLTDEEEN